MKHCTVNKYVTFYSVAIASMARLYGSQTAQNGAQYSAILSFTVNSKLLQDRILAYRT